MANLEKELHGYDKQKRRELAEKDTQIDRITDLYEEYKEKYEDKIHADKDEMITRLNRECNYRLQDLKQYEAWELRVLFEQ